MKGLFNSIVMLVVALVVILGVVLFIAWARLPDVVGNHLSKKMKVSVEIGDINLKTNVIVVEQIEIGNPKGSVLPKAFSAETMQIDTPFANYFHHDVVIDSIELDDIYLGFEFKSIKGTEGNWTVIMSNFKQAASHEKIKKHVLIKSLVLTNISVELVYENGKDQKIKRLRPISRLEFTNVTSEGGIPTDQIMNSILGEMLKAVFTKENLKNMLENLIENPPENAWKTLTSPLKKIFQ